MRNWREGDRRGRGRKRKWGGDGGGGERGEKGRGTERDRERFTVSFGAEYNLRIVHSSIISWLINDRKALGR